MNWSGDALQGSDYGALNIEFLDAGFNPVAGGVTGVDIFTSDPITAASAQDVWTQLSLVSGPAPTGTAYVQARIYKVAVDGDGSTDCSTGLPFFDHMLDQLGRHSGMDLKVRAEGDIAVDAHHQIGHRKAVV